MSLKVSRSRFELAVAYGGACAFSQAPLWRLYFLFCHANEIYISFFLIIWLASAAVGALLAQPIRTKFAPFFALFPTGCPLLSTAIVYPFVVGGVQGVVPGIWEAIFVGFLLGSPTAAASGAFFSLLSKHLTPARLYALESAGFAGAALLVDLLILPNFGNAASLLLAGFVSVWLIYRLSPRIHLTISFAALSLAFAVTANLTALALLFVQHQGRPTRIAYTHAGPVVVTRQEKGESLFLSGAPVVPSDMAARLTVPLAKPPILVIAQDPRPFAKLLNEQNIKNFVLLSTEPAMAPFVAAQNAEPRRFLQTLKTDFKTAIVCLDVPSTISAGRFLNLSFFNLLKKHTERLFIVIPAPSGMLPSAYCDFAASILRAFGKPVYINYEQMLGMVILSNRPLGGKGIARGVFLDCLSRSDAPAATILNLAAPRAGIEQSMQEVTGTSPFFLRSPIFGLVILVVVVIVMLSLRFCFKAVASSIAIFGAGCAATLLHLAVFAAIQARLGALYALLATVSAVFMLGITTGGFIRRRWMTLTPFASVPLLFGGLLSDGVIAGTLLLLSSFSSGAGLGAVFSLCARKGGIAYALDLTGALCGMLLFVTLILHGFPVVGIAAAVTICAMVVTLSQSSRVTA